MKSSAFRSAFMTGFALLAMHSCLDKDYSEHRTVLDVPQSVTVPGDLETGEKVKTQLDIISTGCWSAALVGDPAPSWLKLMDEAGVNLSGASMTLPLRIEFNDNEVDPLTDRQAQICVTIEGDSRIIGVTQEALVPRFSVAQPHIYKSLAASTDFNSQEFTLRINTNNAWKAEIINLPDSTTTAKVELDKTEGFKNGTVKVTIYDNLVDKEKWAFVRISSAWGEGQEDSDSGMDVGPVFEPDTIRFYQRANR